MLIISALIKKKSFFSVMFFGITCLLELVCFILYAFVLPHLPIVKHYRSQAALEGSKTVYGDLSAAGVHDEVLKNVCKYTTLLYP